MRDRLFFHIIAGLEGSLSPGDFEACACDLLRGPYPTLSPVEGGSDAGVDGLIDDGQDEPFPLVITTGQRPIRNLARSLDAHRREGSRRRKVILATSTRLTPQRQRNLKRKAKEKGYQLAQIYEQSWFTQQLYWSPRWRKELLDLSGTPSALSTVPRSRRPVVDIPLVGREADLEWLRSGQGDRVLVGQPGAGKTYLLRHLVAEGEALFLVSGDPGEIADAYLEQRPEVIIVDDAHVEPSDLDRLRHWREEIDGEFSILAVTWPGSRDEVAEALGGVPETRMHTLELLTRDEIVAVYRSAGLDSLPDDPMRELVDQAANKPGLAVTLAMLVLQGVAAEVLAGEAVRKNLLTALSAMVGPEVPEILASFALGGEGGMPLAAVAEFLRLPPGEVLRKATSLSSAGVLTETRDRALTVQPGALRAALLGQVFFAESSFSLQPDPLLHQAPDLSRATRGLIEAAERGVAVPRELLQELVLEVEREKADYLGSCFEAGGVLSDEVAEAMSDRFDEAWRGYASLGRTEALWALDRHSGPATALGAALLRTIPEIAISRLLAHEASDRSTRGQTRSRRGFGLLARWIRELPPHPDQRSEPVRRRRQLAAGARRFLTKGGDESIGLQALLLALSPTLDGTSSDPGSGRTVKLSHAILPADDLSEIEKLWEEICDVVQLPEPESWGLVKSMLWPWIHPQAAARGRRLGDPVTTLMRGFARTVLKDLARLAHGSPGLVAGMRRLAEQAGIELALPEDRIFETLYPPEFRGDGFREAEQEARESARALADRWLADGAEQTADRIRRYETEAQRIDQRWPRMVPELCNRLAERTDEPDLWWRALRARDLSRDLTWPFLRAVVERGTRNGEDVLREALASTADRWSATELVLRLEAPATNLLDSALAIAGEDPQLVETACLRARIPASTLTRLLGSERWEVALAAAVGEWHATPAESVRQELTEPWREAILRARLDESDQGLPVGAEHSLIAILASDAELAFDWLRERLKDSELPQQLILDHGPLQAAIGVLSKAQRAHLLPGLPEHTLLRDLLPHLIGDDLELFQGLLESARLRKYHLCPLQGRPDERWTDKALLALDAGHQPDEIADSAFGWHWTDSIENWHGWDAAFTRLEDHPDARVREVAASGKAIAGSRLNRAAARERELALQGV